jgi:hypothetical protein
VCSGVFTEGRLCSSVGWILDRLDPDLALALTLYERRPWCLAVKWVSTAMTFVEFCGTSVASMIFNDREN